MSMFLCNECDNQIDSDFYGCHEDPKNKHELICQECYDELYEEEEE